MRTRTLLDVTEPEPDLDVATEEEVVEEYGGNSINDPNPSGNPDEDE